MEKRTEYLEQDLEKFSKWMRNLSENGKVGDIEPEVIRGVLESCSANFKELSEEELTSLSRYSNKNKRLGLDAVWGKEKVDTFKLWTKEEYVPYVEKKAGRELHTLWDKETETYDDVKNSGMMQFLGEITAFAAGQISLDKYRRITENRLEKGRKWEYGDRMEPYKPSRNAGVPVDFPSKAMARLRAVI